MIYSGSIIFVKPEELDTAKAVLESFEEIEIHAIGEDSSQIVVSIETENDENLDDLTRQIKSHNCIMDVGHHIMHFEDEVEEILAGNKVPDIKKFQRSRRREKNPLEELKEA